MSDIPRLKHQERGLCVSMPGQSNGKSLAPDKDDVGFDVVQDSRLIAEVLP
jgi:hypothetical protein